MFMKEAKSGRAAMVEKINFLSKEFIQFFFDGDTDSRPCCP